MQDTFNTTSSTRPPLRRRKGPVGGVLSGLGATLGIDANVLRIATALAGLFAGPVVLFAYLAAWMLLPVDEYLTDGDRPASAPRMLIGIVAAVLAIQIVFGMLSNLSIGWLLILGAAGYWLFIKD